MYVGGLLPILIFPSIDIVVGFERDNYTIVEGSSTEVCIAVKEPQNSTIDIFIPAMISTQDGSAKGLKIEAITESQINFVAM